ncbi:VOC family protein [Kitasatospora acidiphila]|uniref:VOC family protein n=1 Tax=Kitasatospora acidiphila TaxID=2567942 RepID=A0A540W6R4_9ACTN|nr:VOC family protein [Kitasatospora acidiphila]
MKVTEILPGSPCWVQLSTSDLAESQRFYGRLFGWTATAQDPQYGGYTIFSLDGAPAAAVAPLMNPQQPVQWLLAFATPSADEVSDAAKAAGAQLWMGPMDVGPLGRWALLSDPTGAPFTLWQAGQFAGFGVADEPNAFGWIDLATRNRDAAVAFYKSVFGWEVTPSEQYPMVGLAGKMFGGVMEMGTMFPPEVPSHWTPFFMVRDVDAAAGSASKLGAEIMHGPVDVEMENGPRIAVIRDPQGAAFGVFAPRNG